MNMEEKILAKLDQLSQDVAELKAAQQIRRETLPGLDLTPYREAQQELAEQMAFSSANLTKWIKFLDQMMELKEDLIPLGKPMMEELIQALDQATHGFDVDALKELIKQFSLNLSNLAQALAMVGSLVELKNDSGQIAKDAFDDAIIRLEDLKQKGFFASMGKLLNMGELVGQKMLELDTTKAKPVKGVFGLYSSMNRKEIQEGLGVMMEMLTVLSVLKTGGTANGSNGSVGTKSA